MDSSTVSSRIVVPAWIRRQSRAESSFQLGIVDSLEQNRSSILKSSTVSNRIAVPAWNRRQSRTESRFCVWRSRTYDLIEPCLHGLGLYTYTSYVDTAGRSPYMHCQSRSSLTSRSRCQSWRSTHKVSALGLCLRGCAPTASPRLSGLRFKV